MESLFLASQRVDPVVMKAFDHEWKYSRLEDAMGDIEGE
jgi:NAD dependent epimerase/dehydratase family enzyme